MKIYINAIFAKIDIDVCGRWAKAETKRLANIYREIIFHNDY